MANKWDESKRKRDKFGRFVSGKSAAQQQINWQNKSRRFVGDSLKRSSVWKNGRRISSSQTVTNNRSDVISTKSTRSSKNGRKASGNSFMYIKANESTRGSKSGTVYKNGKRVKDTRKKK
jgi:hypothetical protein